MTEHLQPGQHLSPDQLSAFAENVLPEHERLAALTHLAGCPACRQVVFLAQQADPTLAAVSRPPVETQHRGWFTLPQIFGAATAALACSLILALIIHQRHTETVSTPPVTTAKVEQQQAVAHQRRLPTPNASAPPPALQSTSPAQISPSCNAFRNRCTCRHHPKPVPQPVLAPAPRMVGAMGPGTGMAAQTAPLKPSRRTKHTSVPTTPAPSASTYAALPPKAPAAVAGVHAHARADSASGSPPMREGYTTAANAKPEKDFPADAMVALLASSCAPISWYHERNATVEISAATYQDLPLSGRAITNYAAKAKSAAQPIQLPSKKPAANMLHAAGRTLALDTAGALFLSLDLGKHWIAVAAQWSGKAVQISFAPTRRAPLPPAAGSE